MIIDDLKDSLNTLQPIIELITTCWIKSNTQIQITELEKKSTEEELWKNPSAQATILKELQKLKQDAIQYHTIINTYQELNELIELFSNDETTLQTIQIDIKKFIKQITTYKLNILLHGENDDSACFLNINSGAGGTESQDWAEILMRMYTRFCEQQDFSYSIIDKQDGEGAGIKSATIYIKGKNAYGFLKSEHGIHRLVRISPFDANKKRHTSFAGISIIAETPKIMVTIDTADLRIDTFRAGGAGGQHVNKTESAIRITHIPTGIVTQCQNERSQTQNKEIALKMLKAKLAQKIEDERLEKLAKIERKNIEWGSQIRSYILHPYKLVKDHRTDFESQQPDLVLDGNIMPFIEKYLINY